LTEVPKHLCVTLREKAPSQLRLRPEESASSQRCVPLAVLFGP